MTSCQRDQVTGNHAAAELTHANLDHLKLVHQPGAVPRASHLGAAATATSDYQQTLKEAVAYSAPAMISDVQLATDKQQARLGVQRVAEQAWLG